MRKIKITSRSNFEMCGVKIHMGTDRYDLDYSLKHVAHALNVLKKQGSIHFDEVLNVPKTDRAIKETGHNKTTDKSQGKIPGKVKSRSGKGRNVSK